MAFIFAQKYIAVEFFITYSSRNFLSENFFFYTFFSSVDFSELSFVFYFVVEWQEKLSFFIKPLAGKQV